MRYLFLISAVLFPVLAVSAQELSPGVPGVEIHIPEASATRPPNPDAAAPTNPVKTATVSFLMDAGVQYADEGEYAEAERAYLRALNGSPGNPEIRFRLGTLYIQMGRFKDAVALLNPLAAEYPDNPIAQNNLAWVYATGGEMKNARLALRHARESILITPYAPSAWNTLAEAYYVSGLYDQALRASDHALDLLRLQEDSETSMKDFEAQRAKILRAAEAYKRLSGLDKDE